MECPRCNLELATMAQMRAKLGKNIAKTRAGEGLANTVDNQDAIRMVEKAMMKRFVEY